MHFGVILGKMRGGKKYLFEELQLIFMSIHKFGSFI